MEKGLWIYGPLLADYNLATSFNNPKLLATRNAQVRDAATDVMWSAAAIANKPSETYNFAAWGANKFGAGLPYAPTIEPNQNTRTGGKMFYYGTNGALILEGGISLVKGVRSVFSSANAGPKIKFIGRMEDLKGIPRNQTILDELPNLGSVKANYYQNMSVIRRNLREGVTFKDASFFRPNSQLAPTLLRPGRTIGQTFLGAERLLLKNRGLLD